MTIQTLFNEIRPKVGDTVGRKFTNSRIIELINEGLEELGKKANVKKKVMAIPILPYQKYLIIPDEQFLSLQRVRQNGKDINKLTHNEMDKHHRQWETKTGERLEAIVYDLQNPKQVTLFPLLKETSTTYTALNNNTAGTLLIDIPNVPSDSVYGLITSMDFEDIIVPMNVYDKIELRGYEPILSLSDVFITLEVTYFAKPDLLDTTTNIFTTVVDLDDSYKNTLVYYVAGTLLLDDSRTENINKASIFIDKYNKELKKDIGRTSNSYQGVDYPEVPYKTGF